jgi:hypothetical protein
VLSFGRVLILNRDGRTFWLSARSMAPVAEGLGVSCVVVRCTSRSGLLTTVAVTRRKLPLSLGVVRSWPLA